MAAKEQVLLERASRFDEQALAEVYDTYSPGIFRYAWRLLGDADLAEDCVSETFDRYLRALHKGNGPQEYLQAYLYRIAHNWITDYYRRSPPPSMPLDLELADDHSQQPPFLADRATELSQLRQALAQLTPEQRQVILLKYLEDWDNQDIAQALNKPVGAIKSLQHRALEALRRLLVRQDMAV
jgi:RNA polymerase sigma-70 factor (ECF subfamily)